MDTDKQQLFIDFSIAFDYFSAPIIFIDTSYIPQYFNFKALKLFQTHQNNFKKIEASFNPYDMLHMDCPALRMIFEQCNDDIFNMTLGEHIEFEAKVGLAYFKFSITPVFSMSLQRSGCCIEINDITSVVKSLHAFNHAVDLAQQGHFDILVPVDQLNHDEPEAMIFKKINTLFLTLNGFVTDIALGLENLSGGNLNFQFENLNASNDNYFDTIKSDFNYTINNINHLVGDIHKVSKTINSTVEEVMNRNSHFAMSVETEFVKAEQAKITLDDCLSLLKINNSEIQQATEIATVSEKDFSLIDQIKGLLKTNLTIGELIKEIHEITNAIDMFFHIHLQGLITGVDEMNAGNLGKGVTIIKNECSELSAKIKQSMLKVNSSLHSMKIEYAHSCFTVDKLSDSVNENIQDMNHVIKMLGMTMSAIKTSITNQTEVFEKFSDLTMGMENLRTQTMTSMEKIIVHTSELAQLSLILNNSIQYFKFSTELSNDNQINSIDDSNEVELLDNVVLFKK